MDTVNLHDYWLLDKDTRHKLYLKAQPVTIHGGASCYRVTGKVVYDEEQYCGCPYCEGCEPAVVVRIEVDEIVRAMNEDDALNCAETAIIEKHKINEDWFDLDGWTEGPFIKAVS